MATQLNESPVLDSIVDAIIALTNKLVDNIQAILSHASADVVLITFVYMVVAFLLYRADEDNEDKFAFTDLILTNGSPDPYKFGYMALIPVFIWGFILLIVKDKLNEWLLLLYFGFAFGPPMFFGAMRVFVSIKGSPEAIKAQKELLLAERTVNGNGKNGNGKQEEKKEDKPEEKTE